MPDLAALAASNPYLIAAMGGQQPDWRSTLANALVHVGAGIAGASASGQPWYGGIAPGIARASDVQMQQQQLGLQRAIQLMQLQEMSDYRKAQEQMLGLKTKELQSTLDTRNDILAHPEKYGLSDNAPGPTVPNLPQLGPADLRTAAAPTVQYLTGKYGLTMPQAAGVAGNLYQESGFNTGAVGDSGKSRGMAQWDPQRYAGLLAFAKTNNADPNSPNTQLDYMMSELRNGDMGAQRAGAMLAQAQTPADAATAMMHFFRPQGYTPANPTGGHGFPQRIQYANIIGGAAPAGGAPTPVQYAPPPIGGQQIPGPPPDTSKLALLGLAGPQFATVGAARAKALENQYGYDWKKYEALQKAEQDRIANANRPIVLDANGNAIPNAPLQQFETQKSAVQGTDISGKLTEAIANKVLKTHDSIVEAGNNGYSQLAQVDQLEALMNGLQTGQTKTLTTQGKALVKGIFGNDILDRFNLEDDVGRAQAFDALAKQGALLLRNPANGGGLPGQMSNYEDKMLQQMTVSLEHTPEANALLIQTMRRNAERNIAIAQLANEWLGTNGVEKLKTNPGSFYQMIDDYKKEHPLFTAEDKALIERGGKSSANPKPAPTQTAPGPIRIDLNGRRQ